jgi:hypothetical protein
MIRIFEIFIKSVKKIMKDKKNVIKDDLEVKKC